MPFGRENRIVSLGNFHFAVGNREVIIARALQYDRVTGGVGTLYREDIIAAVLTAADIQSVRELKHVALAEVLNYIIAVAFGVGDHIALHRTADYDGIIARAAMNGCTLRIVADIFDRIVARAAVDLYFCRAVEDVIVFRAAVDRRQRCVVVDGVIALAAVERHAVLFIGIRIAVNGIFTAARAHQHIGAVIGNGILGR